MLIANMLMFLVALAALAGTTRADCDACIDGRCHSRNTLISGFPITDQMAVDRFANILYLQLNGNMNVAISLNNNDIRLINMMKTTGMVFDENSRKLYLGTKEIPKTFYKYDRVSNTTESNLVLNVLDPDFQDYSGPNLPLMLDAGDWHYTCLKNFTISGLVVDKYFQKVYFVSNNTLYEHNNGDQPARAILSRDHMVLSSDVVPPAPYPFQSQVEVYIGDASEKVIYKLDGRTEELKVYAAYKKGAVADFIFGKNHQLLSRDVDGSVVQWVPMTGPDIMDEDPLFNIIEMNCVIDPPSPTFSIRQLGRI